MAFTEYTMQIEDRKEYIMSNIYDFQKQIDTLKSILGPIEQLKSTQNLASKIMANSLSSLALTTERANYFDTLISVSKVMKKHLSAYQNMNFSQMLIPFAKQLENYKNFSGLNTKAFISLQDSLREITASYDFSKLTLALAQVLKTKYTGSLIDDSEAVRAYDTYKYSAAIKSIFSKLDWSETMPVSDILEEVTEEYIENNTLVDSARNEIRKVVAQKDGKLFTEQQIHIWEVYIYPVLLSLIFLILGNLQSSPQTINNITEIKNYYNVVMGSDINTFNNYNFRIISDEDVMPRIKPDCTSRVVGHLQIGKVVCVMDKYKKWINILWENENGEYYSGWIQNYKVTVFK